jgi:hypothetical protein
MDQVPLSIALIIRKPFNSPGQDTATLPSLCRLYFVKVIDTSPRARPFHLLTLQTSFWIGITTCFQANAYPTLDDIAHGMGEMLSRLHWIARYDGRDVEFIMGGASFSGIAMNIIDFN